MEKDELLRRLEEIQSEYDHSPNDMDGPVALAQLIQDIKNEGKPAVMGLYGGG